MLDLFSGLISLFFSGAPDAKVLQANNWSIWLNSAVVQGLLPSNPDPAAQAIIQQHLEALAAEGQDKTQQALWLQTDHQVLAEYQGTTPLSAASLTKTATTLAALLTWGIDHRFETRVGMTGTLQNGVLQGDLVVEGGGDPLFVWEEAIALGNALAQAGIRRVSGDLVIAGDFAMNFESDPAKAGSWLRQGMNADLWPDDAAAQFAKLPAGTLRPEVTIDGNVRVMPSAKPSKLLIRHQSLPLINILKAMNTYSNNSIAEMLADELGGAEVVMQKVKSATTLSADEVQMVNGSGLGTENRLSPRAISTMLLATQNYLQAQKLSVADLYPVAGIDRGTLSGRNLPAGAAVKTGTLNAVSSLAGVIPTRDRGLVWFTIINLGSGDLRSFHEQQDLLVQRLQALWGAPTAPLAIQPARQTNQITAQLGAANRNQLVQ